MSESKKMIFFTPIDCFTHSEVMAFIDFNLPDHTYHQLVHNSHLLCSNVSSVNGGNHLATNSRKLLMCRMSWFVHLGAFQWFGTYKTCKNVNIMLSSIAKASSGVK